MQNSGVSRGGWQGGKPRNRNEVTQLTGTPGQLGHTIDLGNAVAWSSCVAESSKASYQVGWRSWVRCCELSSGRLFKACCGKRCVAVGSWGKGLPPSVDNCVGEGPCHAT